MAKKPRPKGDGASYRRGNVWWITYPHRGERVREPGGLDGRGARTKDEADEKLRQRLAEIYGDRYIGPEAERLTVEELLDDYLAHLETKGAKSVAQVRSHSKPIREYLAGTRVMDVTTAKLRQYVAEKLSAGSKPATINRTMQDLRAALHLARKEARLSRVPFFPMLREDNARKGFFERTEHEAIRAALPAPYDDVAEFGYRTGWRRGEILPLEWVNVDREAGTVFLHDSKNGDPRTFPLRDDEGELTPLGELIERRWFARIYETKDGPLASAFVFHVGGHRVWDFDEKWPKATKAAGIPGRLFHDYRRTAVRDLVRAGVPQAIAMSITGHKTDAVFRRYNITSDVDKQDAVRKLAAYRTARAAEATDVEAAAIEQLVGSPLVLLPEASA